MIGKDFIIQNINLEGNLDYKYMIKTIKKILSRLFGNKWVCEHCGCIDYAMKQPFCKPCCHIQRHSVKMFKVKK